MPALSTTPPSRQCTNNWPPEIWKRHRLAQFRCSLSFSQVHWGSITSLEQSQRLTSLCLLLHHRCVPIWIIRIHSSTSSRNRSTSWLLHLLHHSKLVNHTCGWMNIHPEECIAILTRAFYDDRNIPFISPCLSQQIGFWFIYAKTQSRIQHDLWWGVK